MHNEMMKAGSFYQQKAKLPKIDFKAKLTATDRINTPQIEGISARLFRIITIWFKSLIEDTW